MKEKAPYPMARYSMTRQLALDKSELDSSVPATDQVARLNSVHARPMPRYLLGRISDIPRGSGEQATVLLAVVILE